MWNPIGFQRFEFRFEENGRFFHAQEQNEHVRQRKPSNLSGACNTGRKGFRGSGMASTARPGARQPATKSPSDDDSFPYGGMAFIAGVEAAGLRRAHIMSDLLYRACVVTLWVCPMAIAVIVLFM